MNGARVQERLRHIELRYGIEYDGVAIEQLSPGTRVVVLLLLYLAVDLNDQHPLIVDQPEENLDPNSVFESWYLTSGRPAGVVRSSSSRTMRILW